MPIVRDNRASTLETCLEVAPVFQLNGNAAKDIIARKIGTVRDAWDDICKKAALTDVERNLNGQRMLLNDSILEGTTERRW